MYSIRETFVFQTEIYTFRIFVPSLCCFFFLSSQWGSVCCCCFSFFFLTRSTRTCRCHSKWSFFGSSVFLVEKNQYNLTSQIRFCILPKKRTLRLLTGGLSWGTQSVFARGVLSSPGRINFWAVKRAIRSSFNVWCGVGLTRALFSRFRCAWRPAKFSFLQTGNPIFFL